MSGIPAPPASPPAAAPVPGAPAPAAPVAEGSVAALPARLPAIERALVMTGTPTGTGTDGLTRIRTSAGELLLKLLTPIDSDRPVTVQLTPGQPPRAAVFLATSTPSGPAAPGPSQSTGPSTAATVTPARVTAAPPSLAATLPALVPGSVLPAQILAAAPRAVAMPSGTTSQSRIDGPVALVLPPDVSDPPLAAESAEPPDPTVRTGPKGAGERPAPASAPSAGPTAGAAGPQPRSSPSGGLPASAPLADKPAVAMVAAFAAAMASEMASDASGPAIEPVIAPATPAVRPAARSEADPPAPSPPMPRDGKSASGSDPRPPAHHSLAPIPTDGDPAPSGDGAAPGLRTPGPPAPATPSPPSSAPPAAASPSAAATPAPAAPAPATSSPIAASPTAHATPPAAPTVLPSAGVVALRILAVELPGVSSTAFPAVPAEAAGFADTPPHAGGAVIEGRVAGTTTQGQPILATPEGTLALNTRTQVPRGTRVVAVLADPAGSRPPPLPAPAEDAVELATRGNDWPALRQIMAALAAMDRTQAQQVVASVVPQPNRKLGAALTFFLSALRGGDAGSWLGTDARATLDKAGAGETLSRLEREFADVQRETVETTAREWRGMAIPVLDTTGLHTIRLYVHRRDDDKGRKAEEAQAASGSRFLLDLDLSRLGALQLDGLVRDRRFELILRSHAALPDDLRDELVGVFTDSLSAVGYTGSLGFQSGGRGWVTPRRPRAGERPVTA